MKTEQADENNEEVPAWFGAATIRSMKNNFLEHMKGCEVCKKAQEVDEVCDEGAAFVSALGMDKQSKPPPRPAAVVKKTQQAKAKQVEWAKRKLETLTGWIEKAESEISKFEGLKKDATGAVDKAIHILDEQIADEWQRIESLKESSQKHKQEIEKAESEIARLQGLIGEHARQITETDRDRASIEEQINHHEQRQKAVKLERDQVVTQFDPKLVALRKDRDKLVNRINRHKKQHMGE